MDNAELAAAFERTCHWQDCCRDRREDDHEYWQDASLQQADESVLIDWAVSRLAADEAERVERAKPIDAHWLRSLKCGEWLYDFDTWYVEDEDGIGRIIEYCDGPQFWFVLGERIWRDTEVTRGQLLDLLRALKGGA